MRHLAETLALHLFYFLLIVSSLSCGSLAAEHVSPSAAIGSSIAMIAGWSLLPHVAARMLANFVRQGEIDPYDSARWLETQLEVFRWLGLGVAMVCLAAFGLAGVIGQIPWVANSMFLQSLLLLTPGLVLTMGTWSAEHHYGVRVGYTPATVRGYLSALWHPLRTGIAWLVAPVVILLGLSDLIGWLPISANTASGLRIAGIAVFVPVVMPWIIRQLFRTESLDPEQQQWIERLMTDTGSGSVRAVRWNTAGNHFNAMVAGFVPSARTLFLSDRLLDELPRDQLAMVVLHEAAHLKRWHLPLRMIVIVPAWILAAGLSWIVSDHQWSTMIGSVAGIIATLLLLRWVSYQTEFDADRTACRMAIELADRIDGVPSSDEQARQSLSDALIRVTGDDPRSRRASWLHPGVEQRITALGKKTINSAPVIDSFVHAVHVE